MKIILWIVLIILSILFNKACCKGAKIAVEKQKERDQGIYFDHQRRSK